jgi:hypothetical protein
MWLRKKVRFALFWNFAQSRMLVFTDVPGQPIGFIFQRKSEFLLDSLTVEHKTDRLSRNVDIKLAFYAA